MNSIVQAAPTVDADVALGFIATGVTVDNFTNQWVLLPGTGRFVPPWQYGVSLPTIAGTSQGQIKFQAPPGQVQPPKVSGQQCTATFTAIALPASLGSSAPPSGQAPGGSAVPSLAQQQVLLGTIVTDGISPFSKSFTFPIGTYAIAVVQPAGHATQPKIEVDGDQSSAIYGTVPSSMAAETSPGAFIYPITVADTSVTVKVNSTGFYGATYYVIALLYPGTPQPLLVVGGNAAGSNVQAIGVEGVAGMTPVVVQPSNGKAVRTFSGRIQATNSVQTVISTIATTFTVEAIAFQITSTAIAESGWTIYFRGQTSLNTMVISDFVNANATDQFTAWTVTLPTPWLLSSTIGFGTDTNVDVITNSGVMGGPNVGVTIFGYGP